MVFIDDIEGVAPYARLLTALMDRLVDGVVVAVTSTLTLTEITVKPFQEGRLDVVRRYEWLLANYPNLRVAPVDTNVALRASQLRAVHRLTAVDAIQVGTSLTIGATAFLTNDSRLSRVAELEVIQLDDLL